MQKNDNKLSKFHIHMMYATTDYGRPVRKLPSLHDQKSTHPPKFFGTAGAYFVCHIGQNFQISFMYAFIGCPLSVYATQGQGGESNWVVNLS